MEAVETKSMRLCHMLRSRIESGYFKTGDRIPSEREIMKAYGVSRETVRSAIGEIEADGVLVRRRGSGTFVAACAGWRVREHLGAPVLTVGCVFKFSRYRNCIYDQFSRALLDAIDPRIHIQMYYHNVLKKDIYLRDRLDALILDDDFTDEELSELEDVGDSQIVFNRIREKGNYICTDNYTGGRMTIKYLADMGHRNVVCVTLVSGATRSTEFVLRYQGMAAVAKERGIRLIPVPLTGARALDNYHQAFDRLLRAKTSFTAIATPLDVMAMSMYEVLDDNGIAVPADMSVIGYDDIASVRHLAVPLTTIKQPLERMAEKNGGRIKTPPGKKTGSGARSGHAGAHGTEQCQKIDTCMTEHRTGS